MTHSTPATIEAVTPTIERWRTGINAGDLGLISASFTEYALFQGSRPVPLFGRKGVEDYYGSQPDPLTVDYESVHFRPLGEVAAIAYLKATFHPQGREDLHTYITLVFEPSGDEWLIDHYHVSFIV